MVLVGQRKRDVPGKCKLCGKAYEGYSTKEYCSPKCYKLAYYRRNRDKLNERRKAKKNPAEP